MNPQTYVNQLRGKNKKQYAQAYLDWLGNGKTGPEPVKPQELGEMAAQGVRLNLANLTKKAIHNTTEW